jgi:hypothetical protein
MMFYVMMIVEGLLVYGWCKFAQYWLRGEA